MVRNITLQIFLANPIATVLIFQCYCFMNTALWADIFFGKQEYSSNNIVISIGIPVHQVSQGDIVQIVINDLVKPLP